MHKSGTISPIEERGTLTYGKYQLRLVLLDDIPWFVARDICQILGIRNTSQATSSISDNEKLLYSAHIVGQHRKVLCVSEAGVFALIAQSKKPEASAFNEWMTQVLLPVMKYVNGKPSKKQ